MSNNEDLKIIESKKFILFLEEDEYQLDMSLYNNNYIEFKIIQNNPLASCYYIEKYNLEAIIKLTKNFYEDMIEVYQYFKNIFLKKIQEKKINLFLSEEKNLMYIKYKTIKNEINEIEVELKLKKINLNKNDNDIVPVLMKEIKQLKKMFIEKNIYYEKIINELKKNNDLLMQEYNKIKNQKKEEEKEEEKRKIEEEKFSSLNDNVNLINNFKCENFEELKDINAISTNEQSHIKYSQSKSIAVYCIIKNNERLYQMAYPEIKCKDTYNFSHIIIYNLLLNKKENKIYKAHDGEIINIKHYFHSSTKNHILLSSSIYNCFLIKLWNISSNPIINILNIEDYNKMYDCPQACLMFKDENFFILGGPKISVWDQNKNFLNKIGKSKIENLNFIEATYIDDKSYILLSGSDSKKAYFSECYNYEEDSIKTYNNNNSIVYGINLFRKGKKIYLITGCKEERLKVNIFDFVTTNLIKEIQLESKDGICSLCSINEKYIIVSDNCKLKIIDMESYSVVKNYSAHYDDKEFNKIYGGDFNKINGIEKIKIPEKGEYIITYSDFYIKIWKF